MRLRVAALVGIAVAAFVGPMVVMGQTGLLKSVPNLPWPAPVKTEEPEVAPILTPAEALKTFTMAPGYHLELVAAEPLVKDPILAEFDGDGRLWVLELNSYAINEQMENSFEPINSLVVIEDTNNDGMFDKRTVFMDKLIMPRAFMVLDKNCALVGAPPNLFKACDTNGDLVSDTREIIDANFSRQGVVEHGANGIYWGMDNTIYVSQHTYNLKYDNGAITTEPALNRGQWGITQDDGGRIYRNVNTDPLFVDYVPNKYYVRNPNLVRTKGLYESLVRQEDTAIWPIHNTMGVNRGYRADIFREDGTSKYYGGVSSPLIYRGTALPKEIYGQPFVVDGPTNIVHLLKMTNQSGNLAADDYYDKGEFLASTDVRFRPVEMVSGWDGTMYVIDMYRGVSQDGPIQTDYLRDYHIRRGMNKGINYGRVYRVVHEGMKTNPKPQMSKDTPAQLVGHLSNPDGWWRDKAQQLLVQRGDKSVIPALKTLAVSAPDPRTRLHAIWTLDGLGGLEPAQVTAALKDASPDMRVAGLRLSERWLASNAALRTGVMGLMEDSDGFVRRQLAATLGELPADQRVAPIVALLQKHGADPITVDIALSGLHNQETVALAELIKQPQSSTDAVAMLAGAASKGRDQKMVENLINLAMNEQLPTPIRAAVMNGVSIGLRGSAATGGGVTGGLAGGGVPGIQRRQAVAGFAITAEPTHLIEMSKAQGELAAAAGQTMALLDWPGKPPPPAVPAMSAEEEARVAAGRTIYGDQCAACHGADGQGVAQIGAKLAGSRWVTADASDPVIRILTNGKEGAIGVMPPLGAGMSDDDLAAVLAYIRRSFGNAASPTHPAEVKETRAAYSHRTAPWTEAELAIRRR
jgi:mono/diheme cytochrome c family protein